VRQLHARTDLVQLAFQSRVHVHNSKALKERGSARLQSCAIGHSKTAEREVLSSLRQTVKVPTSLKCCMMERIDGQPDQLRLMKCKTKANEACLDAKEVLPKLLSRGPLRLFLSKNKTMGAKTEHMVVTCSNASWFWLEYCLQNQSLPFDFMYGLNLIR
jgi:hypothetical protein